VLLIQQLIMADNSLGSAAKIDLLEAVEHLENGMTAHLMARVSLIGNSCICSA
jgi:hypothetical protein